MKQRPARQKPRGALFYFVNRKQRALFYSVNRKKSARFHRGFTRFR